MTKKEQIEEMARTMCGYHDREGRCTFRDGALCDKFNSQDCCYKDDAEMLYDASYRKISESAVVLTKEECENLKFAADNYDPFWFCSFGGCEGVCKECRNLCENSLFVQERKKTAKEILLPLRRFLVERFNYFGKLSKRNEGVSPDNRLFDLGEMDMANCTLDRVKELLEKYGVEVEE